MISKVVIFFNANISMPNFVWKFKQFLKKKEFTLVGPCLSHEIQSKTDFSSEPTPFKCAQSFFDGSNWHVIESTPLPSLVGSTEPFTHRGAKVGSLKVKNHVSSCVGQQSNALP